MPCNECRATFEAAEADQSTRVEFVDEQRPFCCCQASSVSEHSTGAVLDDEMLVRILVTPIHIKGNRVKAAAFSGAEKGGLSLFRDAQATDDEILKVATGLVENARKNNGDAAGVLGVLVIAASAIRQTKAETDERPAFCVYDTALPDIPSHVEAFQRTHEASEDLRLLRRTELQKNASGSFVPAAEFRNGLLLNLAPAR